MKTIIMIIALAATLVACGGDAPSDPSIVGTWALKTDNGCFLSIGIEPDDFYVVQESCELYDVYGNYGGIGVQVETGYLVASDDTILFNPTRSTCLNDDGEPLRVSYAVSKGNLVMSDDRVVLNFERVRFDPGDQPAILNLGCFDDEDYAFTPSVLGDI